MTNDPLWTETDDFLERLVGDGDEALSSAIRASQAAGLPDIQVSPLQGRMLQLLARAVRARRILEIGALGGYSGIWLARAIPPDGRFLSLELEPRHAEVARASLERAGLADRAEVRVGPALDSLAALERENLPPFDLVFIDADKENAAAYFDASVLLGHPGTVVIVDNVVRAGQIRDARTTDSKVQGTQRLLERMSVDPRVDWTVLQTVGRKGHDGWAVAWVRAPEETSAGAPGGTRRPTGRRRPPRGRATRPTHTRPR